MHQRTLRALCFAIPLFAGGLLRADARDSRYNVRDFGATGKKSDNAQAAIQKAVDTCAAAGGGTVLIPAGEYTSGTIRLRSHVRIYLESGATLFASKNGADFYIGPKKDRAAVFFGEDVDNITIEGRGTVDGQAEYLWRNMDFDDAYIRPHMLLMKVPGQATAALVSRRISQRNRFSAHDPADPLQGCPHRRPLVYSLPELEHQPVRL